MVSELHRDNYRGNIQAHLSCQMFQKVQSDLKEEGLREYSKINRNRKDENSLNFKLEITELK